jgi:hypothetical protein
MTQKDEVAAIASALQPLGISAELAFEQDVGDGRKHTLVSLFRKGTLARPPSVRDLGELAVVFRCVELVEKSSSASGIPVLVDEDGGPHAPPVNPEFRDKLSPNLKNFLRLGTSALTPHEVRELALGLNQTGPSFVVANSHYRVGDRVEIKDVDGSVKRGIVLSALPDSEAILTVGANDRYTLAFATPSGPVHVTKLVSSAFLDGRN